MNKINIIGIGFRPLHKKASETLLGSDVVLTNTGLCKAFEEYAEYERVKEKIHIHAGVHEMLDYISANIDTKKITVLAVGDPMFYGVGRLIINRFGRDPVVVYPDLSSVQVAFARVRETANNAFLLSMHGGPDQVNRRKLEHEMVEIPALLAKHGKLAILTDRVNTPLKIAEAIQRDRVNSPDKIKMYVCEKLGQEDERVLEGTPEEMTKQEFAHPNVVIIISG